MEGHIVATYTLIYRFLKQQSQNKAAEVVKKAAKSIVVLRDDIEPEGPPLEDIIREWKRSKGNTTSHDESSSDSSDEMSSESEDSSSADSRSVTRIERDRRALTSISSEDTSDSESEDDDTSDDDSSDDSDEESPAKKLPQKLTESDTSATLSSAGEKEVSTVGIKATKDENKDVKSDSSTSDSSDSDSSSQSSTSDSSDAELSSNSSDSSSSSESSDEEKDKPTKQPPSTPKGKQHSPSESSSSESSSESEDDLDSKSEGNVDEHIAKKRKISAARPPCNSQYVTQGKEKPPPQVKERFQRVKVQNIAPEMLLNNGYAAKGGATNDYGERAHRDLMVTRGAGFRKEKNKKKRGSYRGGEITMENHSIKFDF